MKKPANFLLMVLTSLVAITACAAEPQPVSFDEFWSDFRAALNSENWKTVSQLTSFPLELKGVDDSQGIENLSQEEFVNILPSILKQSTYIVENEELVEKSLKSIIAETKELNEEMKLSENQARVHHFLFAKQNGIWKLVRVYSEE